MFDFFLYPPLHSTRNRAGASADCFAAIKQQQNKSPHPVQNGAHEKPLKSIDSSFGNWLPCPTYTVGN